MKKICIILISLFMALEAHAGYHLSAKVPLPGKSIADARLQLDSLKAVYAVSSLMNRGCKKMSVVNTEILESPRDIGFKNGALTQGNWSELWTVNCCKKEVYVPIKFILQERGCTYAINPQEVKMKD